MTLSEELQWRGFVNQTTFTDIKQLDGEPISFYWGVDPSASSMQIGNFAIAMMIGHLINHGHKLHLLVGGATGMIGDPDGKKDERNLKTLEEIAKNKDGIAKQFQAIFVGKDFVMVDNYDWFKDMSYLTFLRDVGKHVPLSNMLGRDFVQARLGEGGSGISYAEFSYSLIQGYDFLHLYREHGVTLQVCGADQWGNSITGVDLVRRIDGIETHVYSAPLVINKATGVKFGKTEGGAIWLDPKQTSVYQFYQFWLNVDDEGAIDYAKIYTFLTREEIEILSEKQRQNPGAREAQKALAYEVTKIVHGQDQVNSVVHVTDVLFGNADFSSLNQQEIDILSAQIPTAPSGMSVVDVLQKAGYAASKGEARRLIASGAVSLNGEKTHDDIQLDMMTLVKKGKNNFVLVR